MLCPVEREEARLKPCATLHHHPGGNPGANLKSISHRCYLFEVAFVWELTNDTIVLPLGCLQGGKRTHARDALAAKWGLSPRLSHTGARSRLIHSIVDM